jgi:glucose 1-dehydrogenase
MKEKRSGKIINLSSINEVVPLAGEIPYCASKGGVMMLTRAAALELAPYGIHVNALGPAGIDTPLMNEMLQIPEISEGILRQIPFGRLGRPEDVAKAATFLACELSDWVTGHTLSVDGGMHLVGEISYLWPIERVMGHEVPGAPICQPPKAPEEA